MIHGCWTNAAINGTHVFVLQDAGTNCPKGTTAISWNQQGPTGPAGPAGSAGPKGDTGAQGPAGPAGPAGPKGDTGAAGATGAPGTGATVASLASGDPNCATGGASVTDGNGSTAYACNGAAGPQGPQGPTGGTGPAGPQGPPGPAGSGASMACTTDGGAPGVVTISSVGSDNSVSLVCVAPSTGANCTHSNGVGQTYTNCNDALGFDSHADALAAMLAYLATLPPGTLAGGNFTNICAQGDSVEAPTLDSSGTPNGFILWFYTGLTGQVITYSGSPEGVGNCTGVSSGTWN